MHFETYQSEMFKDLKESLQNFNQSYKNKFRSSSPKKVKENVSAFTILPKKEKLGLYFNQPMFSSKLEKMKPEHLNMAYLKEQ